MANYEAIDTPVHQLRAAELDEATLALYLAERTMAAAAGGNLVMHQNQALNTPLEV